MLLKKVSTSFDNIHNREYTGLVLLDLKKTFDSVSHKILLNKLEHYGIRDPTLTLLKSFLQRQQYVSPNGCKSKLQSNGYGVPQGSTLGPLLFILYGMTCQVLYKLFHDFSLTTLPLY